MTVRTEWPTERLEGLLLSKRDLTYGIVQPGNATNDGVPIVRVRDVRNGVVSTIDPLRVAPSVEAAYERSRLVGGELLVTLVGTVGETAVAGPELAGWNVARAVAVARVRPDVGAQWVAWAMKLSASTGLIAERVNTTVQATLNLADLRDVPVPLPPAADRAGIARVLGALEDKIASNNRLLELIPKLIRARVSAAALDEDRRSVPVARLAQFVNGGAYTKGATGSGRMVIRIADLNSGPGNSTVYNDIEVPDEKTARAGDILMSWSGSLGVYRWVLDEAIVNQHIFKVLPKGFPAWLVFDRLDAVIHIFQSVAKDKATTMGHIQRGHLETTEVDIPSVEGVEQLDKSLRPLWNRLLVAEQETLRLTRLRDTLLPALLSGRIAVPYVSQAVEEAIA
jgi:type I restriction enzyme S subunit